MNDVLLSVTELKKHFPVKSGFFNKTKNFLKAVDGVSFTLKKGQTLGLVGESGCGKSTLGRTILRLSGESEGTINFDQVDLSTLNKRDLKKMRQDMQIIFQDPFSSLNPRMTIGEIVREPLDTYDIGDNAYRQKKVMELMEIVGLRRNVLSRYPHEFSGGQRQRVGIARALALGPKFIVADEPVSALDVSVQSQVLNLIKKLQQEFGISFLFISHDLSVIQYICHEVAVMYLGKIVEKSTTEELFKNPKHPYTESLLSAIPSVDIKNKNRKKIILEGDIPSPINPPSGCPFHTRCPKATSICSQLVPEQRDIGENGIEHLVSCHLCKT